MEYSINGITLKYEANGKRSWGNHTVLLNDANDLTAPTQWHQRGYSIEPLFHSNTYSHFIEQNRNLLLQCWKDAGLSVDKNFELDQYHLLANNLTTHLSAIEKTKQIETKYFPIPVQEIEKRISEICGTTLIAKNPFDNQSIFHYRIIRPQQADNNPLHRDVWLEDYDDCINLYIPIAGSNELSSLIIIPESHLWPESRIEKTESGAQINRLTFNVPAVTAISETYHIERPNPLENQVLIFSPYLIHGGAVNLNPNQTRISIEMRLWKC
ncbi:MAG TPA: phytanoyl-CoA dioxygenase family protein [Chryseolinea sp.]|nr:phytanoyl-CoA dioxygenase family protein [Chryseolinea sp.]